MEWSRQRFERRTTLKVKVIEKPRTKISKSATRNHSMIANRTCSWCTTEFGKLGSECLGERLQLNLSPWNRGGQTFVPNFFSSVPLNYFDNENVFVNSKYTCKKNIRKRQNNLLFNLRAFLTKLFVSGVNSVIARIIEFFKFSSVILDRYLFLINFMMEKSCSHLQVGICMYFCANIPR